MAFSLVELLVAIVVFAVGALSLAASSAIVLRQSAASHVRALSAGVASSRFARLSSRRCADASGGKAEPVPGLEETWTASVAGDGTVRSRVLVHFVPSDRDEQFEATVICR